MLVDIFSTPGGCDESIRIYLARQLSDAPRPDGFVVEAWLPSTVSAAA